MHVARAVRVDKLMDDGSIISQRPPSYPIGYVPDHIGQPLQQIDGTWIVKRRISAFDRLGVLALLFLQMDHLSCHLCL